MKEIYDYCYNYGYRAFTGGDYDEENLPKHTAVAPEDFFYEFGDDAEWDYQAEYAGIAQGLKEMTGKDYTIEFDGLYMVAWEK